MADDGDSIDTVKAGTDAHTDRAFGYVTDWTHAGGTAQITLSDGSEWTFTGEERINRYSALLDLSKSAKKPLLLATNEKSRDVGMIFSTMTGVPQFNGETADKKRLQVSIPPSHRVYRLHKDRPWFDKVKTAIANAQKPADPAHPPKVWISFDSVTSEIVDVRPAMK